MHLKVFGWGEPFCSRCRERRRCRKRQTPLHLVLTCDFSDQITINDHLTILKSKSKCTQDFVKIFTFASSQGQRYKLYYVLYEIPAALQIIIIFQLDGLVSKIFMYSLVSSKMYIYIYNPYSEQHPMNYYRENGLNIHIYTVMAKIISTLGKYDQKGCGN